MSSGTSSGGSSFALPSSHNSPFLETFTYPNPSWTPVQMSPYHGMSGIANSETYSQDDSDPISASATSTMTVANSEISQARPTYSHAQQYQSWKDTPSICPIAGDVKTFVPQRMYKPHTGSDRRRYVEEVRLSLPIIFEVEGPNEWGIGLDDALKCRTKRLLDKDTLMFEGCGPSVSTRLEVCSCLLAYYQLGLNPQWSQSGQVHHGVGRFPPRTFVILQVLLRRQSWLRTSQSVFNASSRYI
jgi:hypothetical protein